jgi:hypothetical protein
MEALAAIGLVANIAQFVDCGCKVLSNAWELHDSTSGFLAEHDELSLITTDLRELFETIRQERGGGDGSLKDMLIMALALSKQLSSLLTQLQQSHSRFGVLGSMKKSLAAMRKRDEIERLEQRLFRLRDEVCLHLNYYLRYMYVYSAQATMY